MTQKNKRLTKGQREILLQWIAEGLKTDEINQRAAQHKPRFRVTRQQVNKYRKSRSVRLEDLKSAGEQNALTTGLALRENRIALLQRLADLLETDIFTNQLLWTDQVKGIGGGDEFEKIQYKEFNTAEVAQLRGLLEDIAHEMGDRRPGVTVNNTFQLDMNEWKKAREKRLKAIKALAE